MKVLVTGGAGFIGSHLVDRLIDLNIDVVVLDVLEAPTHQGIPDYINPKAKYFFNSIGEKGKLIEALKDVSIIYHLAATGGFTERISDYFYNNSYLTAFMLEVIRENKFPVKKIIVASSVAVYGEGKYITHKGTIIYPKSRNITDLKKKKWEVYHEGKMCRPVKIDENSPVSPANYYALSKYDQEKTVQFFAQKQDILFTVFRFFLCYGPRQSVTNPYTGICSIFTSRILNKQPVIVYEDGNQTRDFIYVSDLVDACVEGIVANKFDNKILNIATGRGTRIIDVVKTISETLETNPEIEINKNFRISDARHVVADISALKKTGVQPKINFKDGFKYYLKWFMNNVEKKAPNSLKRPHIHR